MPILRFQVEGFRVCKDGSAKGCHGNGLTLMTGRGEVVWELVWELRSMGGGTARTILFRWTSCWPKIWKSGWLGRCFAKRSAVLGIGNAGGRGGGGGGATAAAPGPAGGSRVVESVPGAVSYAGAEAEGRKTVVSRGVAGRGSVATGPAGALDRGKGRGVTVAQSPAQLAHAAAHRDAREPGQGRVTSVGGSPKGSGTSDSRSDCIIPGCRFTSGGGHKRHAVNAHLPKLFGEISSSTSLPDGQMAQLLELVQFIASTAIGCSVEALQRFWRCSGLEARPVLPTVTPLVRGLEAYAGWQSPDEYSASPPNSIAPLLQWNVALSLVGTMGASLRDRCHKWQPSTSAPAQAMEVDTPTSKVQVAAGSSASA